MTLHPPNGSAMLPTSCSRSMESKDQLQLDSLEIIMTLKTRYFRNICADSHICSSLFSIESSLNYRIAGKFRGRKFSWILRFAIHLQKFSSHFGHATPIYIYVYDWSSIFSLYTFYWSSKVFSLESFIYTVSYAYSWMHNPKLSKTLHKNSGKPGGEAILIL